MRIPLTIAALAVAAAMTLVPATTDWGQAPGSAGSSGRSSPTGAPQSGPGVPPTVNVGPDSGIPPQMEQDQARMRAVDRQKQLVSDTQKLLALATELKADVDKTNKDTMSLDVIRKADEIEKLAHSVKEKMKGN